MSEPARDGGFDDWLDAVADDAGYYLECSEGHGSLPPRRVCPHCGDRDISEEPLPDSGEVSTFTIITVPTPTFEDDAPFVTAIVDFGPVSVTGQVQGADPETVETGQVVGIDVAETVTRGDRLVVFEPR